MPARTSMRLASAALLLTLALAASTTPFAHGLDARAAAALGRDDPGRPVVLLVHGRGYLTRDSAAFRRQTLHDLRAGAFSATRDSLLSEGDVRVVWYADLLDLRRREERVGRDCDSAASPAELDASPASVLRTLALIASNLIDVNATGREEADVRGIAGDLRFFGDPVTRCAAEGRIADALARAHAEGRPVVLVAHSLGALVTWGYLQHRGAIVSRHLPEIRRLVTVGSPFGARELRELLLGDASPLALPRGVRSWLNVVNESDPFASRLIGSDSTNGQLRGVPGVADVVTVRGDGDVHDLHGYLRDANAARAVLSAWCEGFERRERRSGCLALAK